LNNQKGNAMMGRSGILIGLPSLLTAAGCGASTAAEPTQLSPPLAEKIDTDVARALHRFESPGAAVMVVRGGHAVFVRAYGMRVATMNDTDNVLLLRPAWQGSGFSDGTRAPRGADEARQNLVVAMICYFDTKVPAGFAESFCDAMRSEVEAEGSSPLAAVVSEQSANNFPAHPIREGEHVFVWFQDFPNARTARSIALAPELTRQLCKPVEILRLRPTSRSRRMASSTMLCRSSA
jgi:hypothetical protein